MSADRYSPCPKCTAKDLINRQELADQYGKIPMKDWVDAARKQAERELDGNTLREDWDIWISGLSTLNVKYYAKCRVCGFSYKFNTTENMEGESK